MMRKFSKWMLILTVFTLCFAFAKTDIQAAGRVRIKVNPVTNTTKRVKGKIIGTKNKKYKVLFHIGKNKYKKITTSKGDFSIHLRKKYPAKTRIKVTVFKKQGKKWKKCGYKYLKVKKKQTAKSKSAKKMRADGLYRYNTVLHYSYKGKWRDAYELPYKTEVKLARKCKYLKSYFKYFDSLYKKSGNKTYAVLGAMCRVANDEDWTYKVTNDMSWYSLFISKQGQCATYASTLCYLSYLSGVDCLYVPLTPYRNHAVNAIEYNGKWYEIDTVYIRYYEGYEIYPFKDVFEYYGPLFTVKRYFKTYSGKWPTKKELMTFSGDIEIPDFNNPNDPTSPAYQTNKEIEEHNRKTQEEYYASAVFTSKSWTYNGIQNGVPVGSKKPLMVSKTIDGREQPQDFKEHKNFRSSNPNVAKIVTTTIGNNTLYFVMGVSSGTATISADIEGHPVNWKVTVIE